MIKASDFITRVLGVKAKAGYIIKDSLSSSALYFFNLSDSSIIPFNDLYIPNTEIEEPSYPGRGGTPLTSVNIYKCSSIDTTNNTWSGYKAIFSHTDRVYSFLLTLTTGLTYTLIKPVVGNIYNNNALMRIYPYQGMPVDRLVLHAPLGADTPETVDGRAITKVGNITYGKDSNIPYAYFDGSSYIHVTDSGLPFYNSDRSFSWWAKIAGNTGSFLSYGIDEQNHYFEIKPKDTTAYLSINVNGDDTSMGTKPEGYLTGWHHYVITHQALPVRKNTLFIDGVLSGTFNSWLDTRQYGTFYIGRGKESATPRFYGRMAQLRVYSKILSQTLINTLASEFTPTSN